MNDGFILRGDYESQKFVMQANIRFTDLYKYAEFTYMTDSESDPYQFSNKYGIEQKSSNAFYQRQVSENRVSAIISYIRNTILSKSRVDSMSLFPTALLLAAHWENPELQINVHCNTRKFFEEINSLYVVDGQHRLFSLKRLYDIVKYKSDEESVQIKEYLENYLFNCVVLLNFDLWEQAKVFADVNFNQKSVNKSLYYSIFGMPENQSTEDLKKSHIFIAHQLTKYMNVEPKSPLYHCIKMLGTGNGYISQAFFADSLIKNLHPRGIWEIKNEADRDNYSYMADELMDYFEVVKDVLADQWPKEGGDHVSILTKTTGIGVMLWIMAYIHKFLLPGELVAAIPTHYETKERQEYKNIVRAKMNKVYPYRTELFKISGQYGSSGGKGQESALRKEILRIISE